MRKLTVDKLDVYIAPTAQEMGRISAEAIKSDLIKLLEKKEEINVMFAAAPSQNTALEALIHLEGINWNRINAYHMDEYVGIKSNQKQSFRNYLITHIFSKLPFKTVNLIEGDASDTALLIDQYEAKLKENGIDLIVLGIGESGHIAFNDPPEAKFDELHWVKEVNLTDVSRLQQVHDKCFDSFDEVPKQAITVTIPAFMSAYALHCIVPGTTKAVAVKATLEGPITDSCPASILRTHNNANLYLDEESASLLKR